VADWLDLPTIRRGDPLEGFVAAAPLRSLPHLLGWTLESLPSAGTLRVKAKPGPRVGWFARTEPPPGTAVERAPDQIARCRLVVADDTWPAHFAARLGVPTVLLLPHAADWLWGPQTGISPWYPALDVLREDEAERLAARLAGC
jgi:hypothetical protein